MFFRTVVLVFIFLSRLRFPSGLSIAEVIRKRYGQTILKLIRKFEKYDFKLKKAQLDHKFLLICKEYKVFPKFLNFKVANHNLRFSDTYEHCQKSLLHKEIQLKLSLIKKLKKELCHHSEIVKSHLNIIDYYKIINLCLSKNEESIQHCKFTHLNKLKYLIPNFSWDLISPLSHDPDKVIFNYSSHQLTYSEKSVLSKGLRFAIPPKSVEYADYLLQYEM